MSDENNDVLSTPGHLIVLAARGFARLGEARLKPLGFGVGQIPVLVALRDGHARTQRDLAGFAKTEQPPMAQMLSRMERDGLIRREANPEDGRSQTIVLTASANDRLPAAIETIIEGNKEVLKGFAEKEQVQLLEFLNRIVENIDQLSARETTGDSEHFIDG